jgi:hypothetical protein
MGEAARSGPTFWDYAMAGLAGFLLLGIPAGIVGAVRQLVAEPGGESVAAAAFSLGWIAFSWWMGVGAWRLTHWARAPHVPGRLVDDG